MNIPQLPPGQNTMANSNPMVIASDQSKIPVSQAGSTFFFSTINSSAVQLAAAATFTGAIEDVSGYPSASILVYSDQNGILTVLQYINASGTQLVNTQTFTYTANGQFGRSFVINGNYIKCTFQNTGGSTTTLFRLDTAYGVIDAATQLNNAPVAINEVAGTAISLGLKTSASSFPVVQNVETASGNITTQNLVPSGVATANSAVEITMNGCNNLLVQVTGTYTGALSVQLTLDGTIWATNTISFIQSHTTATYLATITSALTGTFEIPIGSFLKVRISANAAVTGTATVTLRATQSSAIVSMASGGIVNTITSVTACNANTGTSAHSAAVSGNPMYMAGKTLPTTAATVDTTLVAGDTCGTPMTTGQQAAIKPFGTAELDFTNIFSTVSTVVTLQQLAPASGAASVRNYLTSLIINTDSIGAAGLVWVLDGQGAIGTSVTIATPGVFTSSAHDLKIGDAIVFTSLGTITGVSVNTVYYITATSFAATTFTVATTLGGTALQITGSTAAFTFYRVLYQIKLQTTGIPTPMTITFPTPLRGMANMVTNLLIPTTLTSGSIYITANGYRGF